MRISVVYRMILALVFVISTGLAAACAGPSAPAPSGNTPTNTSSAPAQKAAPTTAPAATSAAKPAASSSAPQAATSGQPVEINFVTQITGQMATSGEMQKAALETYEKYVNSRGGINGRPAKFNYLDDKADAKVSVQLFTDLMAKKVQVIMGPGMTGPTNAVVPLLGPDGPVVYSMSPGVKPEPGSYLFATMPNNMDTFKALLTFFRNKGWNRIAMLSSTDATGADVADSVVKLLQLPENKAMSLVADEKSDPTATSMAAQAAKIKASNPQAIILAALGAPSGTAFKALAQAGLDLPTGTAVGNQNYATMYANKDVLPKEVYFPGSPSDVPEVLPAGPQKDVITAYRQLMLDGGHKPEVSNTVSWEAASIIVEAMKKVGPDAKAPQLRDAIQSIDGFEGLWGTYHFTKDNHRGVGPNNVYVEMWDPGKDKWVAVSGLGGEPLKN